MPVDVHDLIYSSLVEFINYRKIYRMVDNAVDECLLY